MMKKLIAVAASLILSLLVSAAILSCVIYTNGIDSPYVYGCLLICIAGALYFGVWTYDQETRKQQRERAESIFEKAIEFAETYGGTIKQVQKLYPANFQTSSKIGLEQPFVNIYSDRRVHRPKATPKFISVDFGYPLNDGRGNTFKLDGGGKVERFEYTYNASTDDHWYDIKMADDAVPTQHYIDHPEDVAGDPYEPIRDLTEGRHDKGYPKA